MTYSTHIVSDDLITSLPPTGAVQQAVAALAAGRMIVVIDDADREN